MIFQYFNLGSSSLILRTILRFGWISKKMTNDPFLEEISFMNCSTITAKCN